MKDTVKLLRAEGKNACIVTLQNPQYINKAGEQASFWLYTNSAPKEKAFIKGTQDSSVAYECYDLQSKSVLGSVGSDIPDGKIHKFYLNGIDESTIQDWRDQMGDEAICYINDDGQKHLLTETEALELLTAPPASTDDSDAQHQNA